MKMLTVIRHAKSAIREPGQSDQVRPITGRGKHDAVQMGKHLADIGVMPDLLISSPARRALTTARAIALELGYASGDILENPLLYGADIDGVYEVLRSVADDVDSLMITGHNPDLHELVEDIAQERIEKFPTCAVARISCDISQWSELDSACGHLDDFIYPKKLK